jgi:hypothetical protein
VGGESVKTEVNRKGLSSAGLDLGPLVVDGHPDHLRDRLGLRLLGRAEAEAATQAEITILG